ncbi:hypothetical protein [Maritalea porphyrae]|uniref:Uncharacterized protein n=1 Tax=Maritalea porphyrae TaxID=880732 RepID=A0ABQ5UPC4_9HYPH|nr:hypothetical protein [Maritalea porphyrae]GLQ16906.1 hypothetical protein GCM10007879_11550 [Maritalea porphyrae]
MMIFGVSLSEVDPLGLWLIASILVAAIGFVGGQLVQLFVGSKAIVGQKEDEPKFSAVRETVLPGYLANKRFKRMIYRRTGNTLIGNVFFYAFVGGLLSVLCAGAFIATTNG